MLLVCYFIYYYYSTREDVECALERRDTPFDTLVSVRVFRLPL